MYIFPYDDQHLINLASSDPTKYQAIVINILTAENDAVREMYEIDLYNNFSSNQTYPLSLNI